MRDNKFNRDSIKYARFCVYVVILVFALFNARPRKLCKDSLLNADCTYCSSCYTISHLIDQLFYLYSHLFFYPRCWSSVGHVTNVFFPQLELHDDLFVCVVLIASHLFVFISSSFSPVSCSIRSSIVRTMWASSVRRHCPRNYLNANTNGMIPPMNTIFH